MATSSASMPRDEFAPAEPRTRTLALSELAWLVVLPCAALVALAILLLGPPLGHAFLAPRGDRFWPRTEVRPEPVEHARFLLALAAAPLGALALLALARRPRALRADLARALVAASQVCTVLFLALMLLAQHDVLLRSNVVGQPVAIFTVPTLVAAAGVAGLCAYGLAHRRLVARASGLLRETRGRRIVCLTAAVLLVAVYLMAAFNTEHSIGRAESNHLIPWDMAETFAVLNGRTPLVDFHSQYAQLLPYLAAGSLRIFGASVGAWTGTMIALSGLALAAMFAVLRRVVRSSVAALALFVPFLAGSAFLIFGRLSPLEIFSLWPMRYGGPYLLAWLTARQLDGAAPRRRWLLLGAAGLVALNNLEFGLPAAAGTLLAIVAVDPPRSREARRRLLTDLALGALAALGVVGAIALLHGGALPRFGLLFEFPRIYGVGGWVLEPMAAAGLHLIVYATFLAAVMAATVRAIRGDAHRLLTGMLMWSGIFGLGAGSYFAGRSDPLNLISLFSAWCFALVLLTVVVVERLARAGARPSAAELAVLFGFVLIAFAIFQMPRPWAEVRRVERTAQAVYKQAAAVRLVRQTTVPHQKVAVLTQLGHRVAYDAGVVDVAPYSGMESMPTVAQLRATLDAVRRERATQIYVDQELVLPGMLEALGAAGFTPADQEDRYLMLQARASSP